MKIDMSLNPIETPKGKLPNSIKKKRKLFYFHKKKM